MTALDDAQEEAKSDMTPMIDCVFLMIIFFLCIEFKILESKLPAYLPKDKGSQPDEVEPMEQLSVGIYVRNPGQKDYLDGKGGVLNPMTNRPFRFRVKNYGVRWEVGPRPIDSLREVSKELERIVESPSSKVPDPKKPGTKKLMPVVIEPHPGVYYESVARTADACNAAGFGEIKVGGGLGAKPK